MKKNQAKTPGKNQNFGSILKTKNVPYPKKVTLDQKIFLDLKGSPLLFQQFLANSQKSAVPFHFSGTFLSQQLTLQPKKVGAQNP